MNKLPLAVLISLTLLTACQGEKQEEKTAEAVAPAATSAVTEVATAKAPEPVTEKMAEPVANEDAADSEGKALHKANCARCHDDEFYGRADTKMTSLEGLRKMVGMCDAQLGTELFPEELDSITAYLNGSFYKFAKN